MRFDHRSIPHRAPVPRFALSLAVLVPVLALALGCEDEPKKNPFDPPKDAPIPAPPVSAIPKKETAPDLEIDTVSPKVGFDRALLQHPEGKGELTRLLGEAKKWFQGKDVVLVVDRKAKVPWVALYLDELGKVGPSKITVRT